LRCIGAGSNLLIADSGLPGLTICNRRLQGSRLDAANGLVEAEAGEPIPTLARKAARLGLSGLEWAVGIPGTVGGAVVMNAGAHNQSTSDCLVNAVVLSPDGTLETLTAEELGFSYRTSNLQGDRRLVIEATFQLKMGFERQEVMAQTSHNLHQRKNSQPYDKPSCGSVFRNPTPQYAARIIEQLGLKGHRIGGAEVSHRHANFILNAGNAKAQDIFHLICHVQEQVQAHCSLLLEPEVRIMGEFSL
jgi:UDP-N-acetylmuramate dehydrogenase